MRGLGGLVWGVMVLATLVGIAAVVGSRFLRKPDGLDRVIVRAREIDRAASSRLEDLGLRYAPRAAPREPTLNIEQPSDADFEFLFSVLASNDQKARVSAARVLRDIGDPRAVRPLFRAVRGMDSVDVFFLTCAFEILDRPDVSPEVRIAVLVPAWEEHRNELTPEMKDAVRLKLRDAGALDPDFLYESAVTAGDPLVRAFAIRELGELPRPPGGVLAAAMSDPVREVRELAQKTFLLAAAKRGGR